MAKHKVIDADAEAARREYEKATKENREERKRTRLAVRALRWVLESRRPTAPPKSA